MEEIVAEERGGGQAWNGGRERRGKGDGGDREGVRRRAACTVRPVVFGHWMQGHRHVVRQGDFLPRHPDVASRQLATEGCRRLGKQFVQRAGRPRLCLDLDRHYARWQHACFRNFKTSKRMFCAIVSARKHFSTVFRSGTPIPRFLPDKGLGAGPDLEQPTAVHEEVAAGEGSGQGGLGGREERKSMKSCMSRLNFTKNQCVFLFANDGRRGNRAALDFRGKCGMVEGESETMEKQRSLTCPHC